MAHTSYIVTADLDCFAVPRLDCRPETKFAPGRILRCANVELLKFVGSSFDPVGWLEVHMGNNTRSMYVKFAPDKMRPQTSEDNVPSNAEAKQESIVCVAQLATPQTAAPQPSQELINRLRDRSAIKWVPPSYKTPPSRIAMIPCLGCGNLKQYNGLQYRHGYCLDCRESYGAT